MILDKIRRNDPTATRLSIEQSPKQVHFLHLYGAALQDNTVVDFSIFRYHFLVQDLRIFLPHFCNCSEWG